MAAVSVNGGAPLNRKRQSPPRLAALTPIAAAGPFPFTRKLKPPSKNAVSAADKVTWYRCAGLRIDLRL
jgi:hypothetical protein